MAEVPDEMPTLPLRQVDAKLGFNKLVFGRDGLFLANQNDAYVGRSLLEYGEYNRREAMVLGQITVAGDIVMEVGAQRRLAHRRPRAKSGPAGPRYRLRAAGRRVPESLRQHRPQQPDQYRVSSRGCRRGLPARSAFRSFATKSEGNFGGLALGSHQDGFDVPLVTIDDSFKYNRLKLIKIDVEGMEADVVQGAKRVIETFRPVLYVENDRMDKSPELIRLIRSLGYRLWWDLPPLFDPDNFAQNPNNLFPNVVSINMLCVHSSIQVNIGHPEIANDEEHPMRKMSPAAP